MKELFDALEKKWKLVEIEKIEETEYFVTYKYLIDHCREDQSGIVEFEKEVFYKLSDAVDMKYDDMLKNKSIDIIKAYNGSTDMFYEGYDLSVLLVIKLVLRGLFFDNEFIDKIAYVNHNHLESIKETHPDLYERIKNRALDLRLLDKKKKS